MGQSIQGAEHYVEADLSLLERMEFLPFDMFLRLNEHKFIKVFKKDTSFTIDQLHQYQEKKKLRHLYISVADLQIFVKALAQQVEEFKAEKIEPPSEARKYVQAVQNTVASVAQRLGFTPELQAIATKNIKSAVSVFGTNPDLTKLFASLSEEERAEIGQHSVLVANIAVSLAAKLKWSSSLTSTKITAAALFHDISLAAKDRAEYERLQKLVDDKYPPIEEAPTIEAYRSHPNRSANMLLHFQELPPQVDRIIREHHERPDGSGFPNGLKWHEISPLGALLIVSHDLLDFMIKGGPLTTLDDFVRQKVGVFHNGEFRKIIEEVTQTYISQIKKSS